MGFFATFWSWLNNALSAYIGLYTIRVANALEPAVVTIGTIYVMLWGYMHLTGKVEEPFIVGLKRIIVLAAVFGVGLHLWLYNEVIVDTFFRIPPKRSMRKAISFRFRPIESSNLEPISSTA